MTLWLQVASVTMLTNCTRLSYRMREGSDDPRHLVVKFKVVNWFLSAYYTAWYRVWCCSVQMSTRPDQYAIKDHGTIVPWHFNEFFPAVVGKRSVVWDIYLCICMHESFFGVVENESAVERSRRLGVDDPWYERAKRLWVGDVECCMLTLRCWYCDCRNDY